ncbi:MAG: Gfo/Idh/MocA family protein [Gemmatimonadales bacterium]
MSTAPLAVGVAGVGSLGFHHARLYGTLPDARLVGVYDVRAERAAEVASQLKTTAFPTYDALLEQAEAVSIVTPTPAHHAAAMAAIARGRHVLVEKPLAATILEAEALVEAAEKSGLILQTGHVERFNRAVRAAAPYLKGPRYIESDRVAPFGLRGSDVAVILDLMIHDLDLVLSLVKEKVVDVRASGIGVLTRSVDIATARIEFASGAVANLTASRMARERVRKLRIFQPSGYLSLDLAAGTGEFLRLRADAMMLLAGAMAGGGEQPDLSKIVEEVPIDAPAGEPLALELQSFVRAVRGEESVAVSGRDGLEALRLAFRVLEAMGQAGQSAPAPRPTP